MANQVKSKRYQGAAAVGPSLDKDDAAIADYPGVMRGALKSGSGGSTKRRTVVRRGRRSKR